MNILFRHCEAVVTAASEPVRRQVVIAPCQPMNCHRETFVESVRLARDKGVRLHTHVGEGESSLIEARHGTRTVDHLERMDFAGTDTWYAHCWELNSA